jgi:hypothetical protein
MITTRQIKGTIKVTAFCVDYDVEFVYTPGWPGSCTEPPEPAEVEVLTVCIDGWELQDHLNQQVLDEISLQIKCFDFTGE